MQLANIMKSDIVTTMPGETATGAWELMQTKRCHHLIVMDLGKIVGILSERDLGGPHGDPVRKGRTVGDLMVTDVVTAERTTTLHDAARLMKGNSIGCLPITEGGRLTGIITVTDLLMVLAGSSE